MKLLVACDAHIYATPDGKHWCENIYGYDFWKRYLNVFDEVKIVARMKEVASFSEGLLVDGPRVEVYGIPFFQGPKQFIPQFFSIWNRLKNVSLDCEAALMRVPGITAQVTSHRLHRGIPLAGEIVYDVSETKDRNFLLWLIDRLIELDVRAFCRKANGVSYVTRDSIQAHFPSHARLKGESERYFETYYSTITLPDEAFSGERKYENQKRLTAVLTSVAMNSERKGERRLISAVYQARQRGYDVSAVLVGDGTRRHLYEEYAEELGIRQYIRFTGMMSTLEQVRAILAEADIYVLPTRSEGLPRGIIEAMAMGLPVLSTPVGGIPEIIEGKYLFEPDDIKAFGEMLCHLLDHNEELNEMSRKNYQRVQEFRNSVLQERRDQFYQKLRKLAEEK